MGVVFSIWTQVHARETIRLLFISIPVPSRLFVKMSRKRACKATKNWEVYMPKTVCMKRTSVHIKNMQIKPRYNGCENILGLLRNGLQAQVVRRISSFWTTQDCCIKSLNSSQLFHSVFVALIIIIGTLTFGDKHIRMIATVIRFQNFITSLYI